MFQDITKPPPSLPTIELLRVDTGVSVLSPLVRRGTGPPLIILTANNDDSTKIVEGVPSHLVKWAEEGFTVAEIQQHALEEHAAGALKRSIQALRENPKCEPKDNIGLVAYEPASWNLAADAVNDRPDIKAAVIYADASEKVAISASKVAVLHHLAGSKSNNPTRSTLLTEYHYPGVETYKFATPFHNAFHYTTEALSHTRSLTHLKSRLGGPYFDLEVIWDEHCYYEFADRSVEHTMSTMVQEPYVNHVPTLTGGVSRGPLTDFYRHNFIFNNSADTALELVSRSIAIDRVIDEFIFSFTHDRELDWLVPGIPPTNLKVEVPFSAVVNIRGDRLYHEHISWDQGTVLRQLGLLPEYLPFPHPLPDGRSPAPGKSFEYRVPVAGTDTANKMRDRNLVQSNEMFDFKIREV
ncbi:hypothetical protein C7974DRAFT_390574 [Boeremia exigua]|uniref:uncharacterized protein n=1 Tax=Boeremia exigua TaxID=749465 RepID=UPI001E8ECFFF|nr:uncharacterized protein C7974DRAFT_390574 [Boeremia exigua]KAH6637947.1 hypothetical protein C7974DRAFT_390574 [Boeremia exigua]